jgi:hypothetical protein
VVCTVVYAPFAAADLERPHLRRPTHSLTELPPPQDRFYLSSWADAYGQMPELGIGDDTSPFGPDNVDSRSPPDADGD